MSNNIDQENPSASDDNTDATNVRSRNDYFRGTSCEVHILWIKLTLPNLFEKNEKYNGH